LGSGESGVIMNRVAPSATFSLGANLSGFDTGSSAAR